LLEENKKYSSGFFMGLQSFRLFVTGEHKIAVAIFQKQRVEFLRDHHHVGPCSSWPPGIVCAGVLVIFPGV